MTRPQLAIIFAAAVMLLLAAAALLVGYLTVPPEKKISHGGSNNVATGDTESLIAAARIQNNLPQDPAKARPEPVLDVTPGVIYTASFTDLGGKSQSLGQ